MLSTFKIADMWENHTFYDEYHKAILRSCQAKILELTLIVLFIGNVCIRSSNCKVHENLDNLNKHKFLGWDSRRGSRYKIILMGDHHCLSEAETYIELTQVSCQLYGPKAPFLSTKFISIFFSHWDLIEEPSLLIV